MRIGTAKVMGMFIGVWALLAAGNSQAAVTVLQNGVSPTADYAGCQDTGIVQGDSRRNRGSNTTLSAATGRATQHILIRFDLAPIPPNDKIHRVVLRLAEASYPRRDKDGKFTAALVAHAVTRSWKDSANWTKHTLPDPAKPDEGDWQTPGSDHDVQTDFGLAGPGVAGTGTMYQGEFGHMHEIDITEVVRRWHTGKLANNGLLLTGECIVASSEWPVPTFRPKLIVDHGERPTGIEPLKAAPADIALDAVAQTPDPNQPKGDYAAVRVGQNANCVLRGNSTDAYLKDNAAEYPGTWGWTTYGRVGGVAGDVSRTLMYFDLSGVPNTASIKSAKLVCSLVGTSSQVRNFRYGAFVLNLPDPPGWSAAEATVEHCQAGKPWPKGSARACSGDQPAALGQVSQKEYTDSRGQKSRRDAEITFDLTGAVRAWVTGQTPNCGIVLDSRVEGGAYDIHGSRAWQPELRPFIEIEISPPVAGTPAPIVVDKSVPAGDYWVEPMREVHKQFKGKAGTLAQYGDSITITDAFLSSYAFARKIEPKNCPPDVKRECEVVEKYADLSVWRGWKGIGNTGMTTSAWLFRGAGDWQRRLNPEAAVIMFGTNDGMPAPEYTENIASACRRIIATGTVPILTSPPPKHNADKEPYRLACVNISHALKIPLIDFQAEILRRRPDDWDGQLPQFKEYKGYQQPTLMHDAHPSNASQWVNDFSEEGLNKNGYNLRNYMTIRMYSQVIAKVFQHENK